ncbi:conserved hypothetical protein [Sulfolobus islandicus Y.G.57.14]|jgi:hypothetical protein|uniref:Uncharacterized protein n=4 Tax=Saccharolobus islandicus TaxID=43080 RepID=C3MKB4_SACI2|nr:hypothetical protein [Sulfolobus islandicus]ACP34412.1 conserved hypothetical protein [Sulfolobus islandicus L.S.2.15]ACP44524.1 conserved hypothetical protein [Sulfolobus islandicus Y.G.57.14]ACP49738.1 conserved hypothetical protein [Sulfolobus islandicus Y.N.15.51]ADB86032.1 conserved hypothetical protein [Sulfolobus islandicus L.D.8.5]PVU78439.1 hypothetical protein DDW12_02205 [Sulfolobus islandicus]
MEELDLTKAESGCGANSASVRLLKFWLEVGGNREIKVIAQKGSQEEQVNMWIGLMSEKGVKLVDKKDEKDKIVYTIFLP